MSRSAVTVLGLGAMGSALARAFLRRGDAVTVWNRSAAKADPLATQGARVAPNPRAAVEASPLVAVCLLDYGAVREVLTAAAPSLAGRVVVNLTNGTPDDARTMAEWVTQHHADYLDGGIMAVPSMIGQPDALVLYSGSQGAFRANRTILDGLGTSRFLGVDPGLAPLHDLALLSGMYGLFAGFLHAVAMVDSVGVKAGEFMELLVPWFQAMSGALPGLARQVDAGDYTLEVSSNLRMQVAAFDHILAVSRAQGVDPKLLEPLHALLRERLAAGHPDEDISGAIELIRPARSAV